MKTKLYYAKIHSNVYMMDSVFAFIRNQFTKSSVSSLFAKNKFNRKQMESCYRCNRVSFQIWFHIVSNYSKDKWQCLYDCVQQISVNMMRGILFFPIPTMHCCQVTMGYIAQVVMWVVRYKTYLKKYTIGVNSVSSLRPAWQFSGNFVSRSVDFQDVFRWVCSFFTHFQETS